MFESMTVNGKEYLPSAEIAQRFGYTSDYVSRLAREGKVVASNVNRKWFIQEESLKEFVSIVDSKKEVRSLYLKKQRKVERLMHVQEIRNKQKIEKMHVHVALTQSLAVVMCGLFVGMLGWMVSGNSLSMQDFASGVQGMTKQVKLVLYPSTQFLSEISKVSVASVFENNIK